MTMEWYGGDLVARVNAATIKAMPGIAEMVLAKSKQVCPVETGALKESAQVQAQSGGKTQELSYNTPYAHRQHEDLSYNHPVGQAKYLEQPLRESAPAVLRLLNEAAARGLR